MKKTFSIITAIAIAAGTASIHALDAKTASELRVYVDPGHGGFGSGDRHMGTIKHGLSDATNGVYNDTTGFFESNTNLWKCQGLVDKLRSYGLQFDTSKGGRDFSNNIVMSRVKNVWQNGGPDITEIAREVYDNNFDFFISVHSNAHVDGSNTNYPAFFVRGENRTASAKGSDDAARTVWPYAFKNEHSYWSTWSLTNMGIYYDIDFWSGDYALTTHHDGTVVKGYYAVLRHNTPGFLVEGYFHTYQPARHRAMNRDVCRHEGEAYARGIADIFSIAKESTGEIYGIVRDKHEKFTHQYYHCSAVSPDALMPLNNVKVELLKDGHVIKEYITDDEWNGAFLFTDLAEGEYYIKAYAEGYKEMEDEYAGPYTVKAAAGTYPCVYLESSSYVPPQETYYDYPDEIDNPAIKAASSYDMTPEITDLVIQALAGKNVKRFIARGDKLYVLAHDSGMQPTLMVFDANTLQLKAEVSTQGTEGTESPLSDIQVTADGVLIGVANELCHYSQDYVENGETLGVCNIYKWDNDETGTPTGNPAVWFTTKVTANFIRAYTGYTMAYSGTINDGTLLLPSASYYNSRNVWLNIIDIVDGQKVSESFVNQTRDLMNMDALGEDYTITMSPLKSGSFIVNSSKVAPMQFAKSGYLLESTMADGVMATTSARESYFKYAGHSMMAIADMDGNNNIGVRLLDITDGIDQPKEIATTNTALEATDATAATAARPVITRDSEGVVTRADIDLYAIRGNKITRFTTSNVEQSSVRGNWAYGLNSWLENQTYTLAFSLTDNADARIELTPIDGDGPTLTIGAGSYTKGINSVTIDKSEINDDYNWKVVVENEAVPAVKTIFKSGIPANGVVLDLNPESKFFGNAYVAGWDPSRGIYQFSPDLIQANSQPYQSQTWDTTTGASPYRMGILPSGIVLTSDWSDGKGGIYKFDPENPDGPKESLFAGTINTSSGEWTYDGKVIGGSTSGLSVIGTGNDTRLYTFQEDYPSDYKLTMCRYDIGDEQTITRIPEQTFPNISSRMINGNVDVVVTDRCLITGQLRYDPNNTTAVPVFLISDLEGNILLNSGGIEAIKGGLGTIACTRDGSRFVFQDNAGIIHVASLNYEPELTYNEEFTFNVLADGGSNTATYQMAFDPAGNLYVANRSSFRVFALPREAVETTTPARADLIIKGETSAIDAITDTSNAADEEVEYFNLQGIRVDADNIPAGIYIRRQGKTTTKVVVK